MISKARHTVIIFVAVAFSLLFIASGCASRRTQQTAEPIATVSAAGTVLPDATATDGPVATPYVVGPDSPLPTATAPASPLAAELEPLYTYEVVAEYPYDQTAFTQGLVYTNSVLYVGTGLRGESSLRTTDLDSGEILQSVELPDEYFGEGIAVFDDMIYQLTWQEHEAFVYDKDSLSETSSFTYTTEGWGLTYDGKQLIMSDGTPTLYFRDPETFEETRRVLVTSSYGPLRYLNELEYINGEIYANVWTTDWIVRIDPETGKVLGWIDLSGLLSDELRQGSQPDVLNGIAYDAENDRLFVTGKLWPRLFEIKLVRAN
ncbi:MAG: glutaminyl-peptide cyclotransferase [Caldilineaceae bacterium]